MLYFLILIIFLIFVFIVYFLYKENKNFGNLLKKNEEKLKLKENENVKLQSDINNIYKNYEKLEINNNELEKKIKIFDNENIEKEKEISRLKENNKNLDEKIKLLEDEKQKILYENLDKFKNIANEILENNSKKFSENSQKNISSLINPFTNELKEFREKIENYNQKQSNLKIELETNLKNEIENMKKVAEGIGLDAKDLASALKGDKKKQGNWGEIQLEKILEFSGLEKNIHYEMQPHFNENNDIPDCIVKLPDDRNLIIDSKVSLINYMNYYNSENKDDEEKYLNELYTNIENHIENLAKKNYSQKIVNKKVPDYTIMFIPIEAVLSFVCQKNLNIYEKAFEKHIILQTTSTLLATLRTIEFIWRQDKIQKNCLEIQKIGTELYEKILNFLNSFKDFGYIINKIQEKYNDVKIKIKGKGNITSKLEKLKELGIKSIKDEKILDYFDTDSIN